MKRKDERPERKPRIDTARFVKGRRGKPSEDAPAATAPAPIARRASATRSAAAGPAFRGAAPKRPFAPREDRGETGGFARPRGPEFSREPRRDDGFAAKRPYPRKSPADSASSFEERPKRSYTRKPEGAADRKPGGFARKPADGFKRREGAPAGRGPAKRDGAFGGAPAKRTAPSSGGFGFDKFTKPKFVKPSKHRNLGSDKTAGFEEGKPFGDRPYSKERGTKERGPGSDRGFTRGPAGKPSGFPAGRKYSSKGPGKPAGGEKRSGGEFQAAGRRLQTCRRLQAYRRVSSRWTRPGIRQRIRRTEHRLRSSSQRRRLQAHRRFQAAGRRRHSSSVISIPWRQCATPAAPPSR